MEYTVVVPPAVAAPIATIPQLALTLSYNPKNELVSATHLVHAADTASDQEVFRISQSLLAAFWEAVSFRYGTSLDVRATHATRTDLLPAVGLTIRGIGTVKFDALKVRPIVFPTPSKLQAAPPRVATWLHLANLAAKATSDADAVRNYYMIIEDRYGSPGKGAPAAHVELKHCRDFVSHGKHLESKILLAFLKKKFGKPVTRYEPKDPTHRTYVQQGREAAQELIVADLEALL